MSITPAPNPIFTPKWATGSWYDVRSTYGGTAGTATPTANSIYAAPIYVPNACSVDRIGVNVSVAAGTVARLMLYSPDPVTGLPGTLLLNAGTVDPSTTGDKTITIAQALPAGIVYVAYVCDGAASIQTVATTYSSIFGATTPGSATLLGSPNKTNGGTTAPTPFGTPAAYSSILIRVALRAA